MTAARSSRCRDTGPPFGSHAGPAIRRGQGRSIELGPHSGVIRVAGDGLAVLDRKNSTATLETPAPIDDDALVHPLLSYVGVAFAGWLGRHAFHAGGVVSDGGVWALLGERGAGKSSTLGWLARAGHPIFTDDLVVIDGGLACAGPRTIDLAPDMASHLGLDGLAREVRGGFRRRLAVGEVEPELPLRGWIVLSWSKEIEVVRVGAGERLARLAAQMYPPQGPPDWNAILDLAEAPMLELRRPRRLSSLAEAGDALIAAVEREARATFP